MTGCSPEKLKNLLDILNKFGQIEVSKEILELAAYLQKCYESHEDIRKFVDKISIGDRVIAATCFKKGCLLFTSNRNDFPAPFFREVDNIEISYNVHRSTHPPERKLHNIAVLEPNLEYFSQILKEVYDK